MAKAILINDRQWERDYEIHTGELITLKLEEDLSEVTFWDAEDKMLGVRENFVFIGEDSGNNRYLLARMYIAKKGCGLGRAALEMFIDITGASVYARLNDGITRDDGSHLTGDAPSFVIHMQKEGLIEEFASDNHADDDSYYY
jgi:hypothetical protein